MTEALEHESPTVIIRLVADICTTPELAAQKQLQIAQYLAGIGGVSAEITSLDENAIQVETPRDPAIFDMQVEDLLEAVAPSTVHVRTRNALNREGIYTVSDLLVMGKAFVMETRNIGRGSLRLIEDALAEKISGGVEWTMRPTMADRARVCDTFGQLPSALAQEAISWPLLNEAPTMQKLSAFSLDDLAEKLGTYTYDPITHRRIAVPDHARAQKLQERIKALRVQFIAARLMRESSHE